MKKATIAKSAEKKEAEKKQSKTLSVQKKQPEKKKVKKYKIPAKVAQNSEKQPETEAKAEPEKKEKEPKKGLFGEILRFVVVGVIATLIDLVVELLVVWALGYTGWKESISWGSYLIWGIGVAAGFLVSNLANYLLSFIWVFQNVDRKKTKRSGKALALFTLLSAIGLFIGIGMQLLGNYVSLTCFNIDLGDLTAGFMASLQNNDWKVIVAFLIVFVIKTAVTMVYNFVSRKLVIFKKPKEEKPQSL